MAFNWRPSKINTQLKGLPQNEDPFDYISKAIQREDMAGYRPSQNVGPINYQHGGNAPINYDGYSPTTSMTEEEIANNAINNNVNTRQFGNAGDMANWIQQGGTPQADAAAAQAQAEQQAAMAKQKQIADIQSQISVLEKRIADNKAKLSNWTGNADKIAAIEARKINAQDPTSIWRWKESLNQQRINRQEDLERIAKEKEKTETNNLKINRNKIDNILQSTNPTQGWKREKLDMAVKQLNDAEELAKNYNDSDSLKKIYERKNELGIYVPVDDEANLIDSEFIREQSMVGKTGGKSKAEFAKYVNDLTTDPKYKHIWTYYPELLQKLYAAIGKNTGAKPSDYGDY